MLVLSCAVRSPADAHCTRYPPLATSALTALLWRLRAQGAARAGAVRAARAQACETVGARPRPGRYVLTDYVEGGAADAKTSGHALRNAVARSGGREPASCRRRFAELAETKPANVSYIVLRLADDSFLHVSFHDHGDDEVNPIASASAFAHFQDGHAERRDGGVDQQRAELVGAYITKID